MDIFQLIGDFLHLMAVVMLILKIMANRNVVGIYSLICRSLLQNPINVSCCFPHPLYRSPYGLENTLSLPHENLFYRLHRLHYPPHEIQKTILSQLWPRFWLLPPLLSLLRLPVFSSDNTQIAKPDWFRVEFQHMVGSIVDIAAAFDDKQTEGYREHNGSLRFIFGFVQNILHISLVCWV